jgi:hypothetical protein
MRHTGTEDIRSEEARENTEAAGRETAAPEETPSETSPQRIRGPLRYQVGVSLAQLEAGTAFTLSLQITNPYDVPVEILDVNLPVPVEFIFDKVGTEKLNTRISTGAGVKDILQPGNSRLKLFALRSIRAIFFTPASYNLYIELAYQMDGRVHHDAVNYQLNIRAPLKALIVGSVFGSIIGYLLRDIFDKQGLEKLLAPSLSFSAAAWVPWLVGLFGNILLGMVLVIAFARKKDTQPILSVEDIWGGLFVGFLAGYTGKSILSQVLPSTASG